MVEYLSYKAIIGKSILILLVFIQVQIPSASAWTFLTSSSIVNVARMQKNKQALNTKLNAFGKQSFWESSYESELSSSEEEQSAGSFSWYCNWEDLAPFVTDLIQSQVTPVNKKPLFQQHVLLPGIGNDPTLLHMAQEGYTNLSAFDYAPSAITCCKNLLSRHSLSHSSIQLNVADARDLQGIYSSNIFDFVLDKGTLDSIFLIGGDDKNMGRAYVHDAISELYTVMKPGAVILSVTAVVPDVIGDLLDGDSSRWCKVLDTRDGVFISSEGYASINVDATMIAYIRMPCID